MGTYGSLAVTEMQLVNILYICAKSTAKISSHEIEASENTDYFFDRYF